MQEIYASEIASEKSFTLPDVRMPGDTNVLKLTLSHWMGGTLDLDLDVSYDGGSTWHYGGGCKGAVSAEPGISFHFTYQNAPTHVRGVFTSGDVVEARLKLFAGD